MFLLGEKSGKQFFPAHLKEGWETTTSFFFKRGYPPGKDHISPSQGTFESMIFLFPFGGICDRSLEGKQNDSVFFHGKLWDGRFESSLN